jgi:uncharacterized protein YbjT (DUF2867 family)
MKNLTALIVGTTSLVGNHCLQYLLQDPEYSVIKVLTRRSLTISHSKLQEYIIDFEKLEDFRPIIQSEHIFCCLGTTIKQAGSQAAFRKIDYSYPSTLARIAKENQFRQFVLISAMGANEKSKIFYNRTKGDLEKSIIELNFPSTIIFRPSLLLGERSESRAGEKYGEFILKCLTPFLQGSLKKYRPIQAQNLAAAMVEMAKVELKGIHIFESDQIQFYYDRLQKNIQAGIIPAILPGNQ